MSSNGVLGTNSGPITFPGIASGIDYNSIIQKLTSLTLAPTQALNAQVTTLNNANLELIKINNYLQSVQSTLVALSNPDIYDAYGATSTNTNVATASGIPGVTAIPGAYTVDKVQTATATSITSSTNAGYSIKSKLTAGTYAGQASDTVPLVDSYAAVTPSDGSGSQGSVTVDGVSIKYDVNSQSLDTILNTITSQVDTSADAGFLATLVGGVVKFTSSDQPIALGSAQDQGNILDVMRLSNAHVLNTAGGGSVTGTANVGGINPDASFDNTNAANFKTAVTAGTFSVNGVTITVSAGQSVNDVLTSINASDAGVQATFDTSTNKIVLTATATGPQSIVLSDGTSNFLSAADLTTATGGKTSVGSQAAVEIKSPSGTTQWYYSNSNTVTTAIPGISLSLQSNTNTPFTINVAQDTSALVSAVSAFVSAYNAAVTEINTATQAPVVTAAGLGSGGAGAQSFGGGVLFGNNDVRSVSLQLSSLVSGFLGAGSSFNSLSQIGLTLNDNFSTYTSGNNSDNLGNTGGTSNSGNTTNAPIQSTSYEGTDGTLQALNVTAFTSALESNPSDVAALLNGANGLTTQLGAYLTGVTGAPTILNSGPVGNIPSISTIQNYENTNTDSIQSLQQQITQITDNANEQANNLRQQFVASETLISQLQAEQQELAAAFGFSATSSTGSGSGA